MSEALSSSEIEDVLSSIRRLVSDDMRPAVRHGAQPAPEDQNKLLLTPALRVVAAEVAPQPEPGLEEVLASVRASVRGGALVGAHVGVGTQDEDWESETGDLAPGPVAFDAAAAQDWSDVEVAAYAEPVLPDARSLPPQEDAATATVEEEILQSVPEQANDILDQPMPGWAQPASEEEDNPPLQAAYPGSTLEPDQAWADQAEAAVLQELTAAGSLPQHGADEFEMNDAGDTELPLDEAMLREIVRDVLREELQGRLGERITRNIRKLVRAEIARVMAAEELF